MNDHDDKFKLWSLNRRIAALRFEYYEIFSTNRVLAAKLFGYRASFPEKFSDDLLKKMKFYLFAGRE
jgi:hypothetical protein